MIDICKSDKFLGRLEDILECLRYLCAGSPPYEGPSSVAHLLDGRLIEILQLLMASALKVPFYIFEIEGGSDDIFDVRSVVSNENIVNDENDLGRLALALEHRVLVVSKDASIAVFSDFNDFQILIVEGSQVNSNCGLFEIVKGSLFDSSSYQGFDQNLLVDLTQIQQRVAAINDFG